MEKVVEIQGKNCVKINLPDMKNEGEKIFADTVRSLILSRRGFLTIQKALSSRGFSSSTD